MKELGIFKVLSEEAKEEAKKDMSKYQRNLFDKLIEDEEMQKGYRLKDLVFDFDKEFVELVLKLEIEEYLKENKEDNRLNGVGKQIKIKMGERELEFNRPRLRKEKGFDSKLIPKRRRFIDDISDDVMTLYAKNNSVNDIKEILQSMFGLEISQATISEMTQRIGEEVMGWRNRELSKCYFTLNVDCTYIKIRDNKNLRRHKVPIYIAVGTKLDGHKEIVGMYLGNEDEEKNIIDELHTKDIGESSVFWATVFNDLKDRGVEKILYLVSDGQKGMEQAVKQEFEGTRYQRCVIHLARDLCTYIGSKDRKEIVGEFTKIYKSVSKEIADENYKSFVEKYKSKKTLIKRVEEYYEYIRPLFDVPENIRKYIYTNNIVESANSKVKRGFYGRGALPNVESAINIIYVNLRELGDKWSKRQVNNWDKISDEIMKVHYEEIKKYL